jgi:hypothetical protein
VDPFNVFKSLGPINTYRHPDSAVQEWATVEAAQAELRNRFDACQTDRERLAVAVDVAGQLVAVARRRSSDCQLKCPELGCENIDLETVLADWVEFIQSRIQLKTQAQL